MIIIDFTIKYKITNLHVHLNIFYIISSKFVHADALLAYCYLRRSQTYLTLIFNNTILIQMKIILHK